MRLFLQQLKRLFILRNKEPYLSLSQLLGFHPNDVKLYEQALTHRSSHFPDGKRPHNNERLEFLGDAILGATVADILYKHFPNKKEGFLTSVRSKIVQRETLNRIALEMGLDKMTVASIRPNSHNNCVYGNALEALIGAIYLDHGYRKCFKFVKERMISHYLSLEKLARKEMNFKSNLLEWGQKEKLRIDFELTDIYSDKNKNPIFHTTVSVESHPLATGTGYTKKESQQTAAKKAIRRIRTDKNMQSLITELKRQSSLKPEGAPM